MKLHGLTVGCLMIGLGVAGVSAAGCTVSTSSGTTPVTTSGSGGGDGGTVPQGCATDTSLTCSSSDQTPISCPSGTSPDSASYVCSDPTPNADGTDGYCCIAWTGSTCAADPSVSGCQYPSYGFSCTGTDSPDSSDPTLVCSTATVDPSTGDSLYCCTDGSSTGGGSCAADPSLSCDPGSDGVTCPSGGNPEADFPGYICSAPSPQPDGTDGYCCATGFSGSTCAQDPTVDGCAYPSVGFSCAGTDTPDQADPSLNCSTGVADPTTGNTLYCCQ